MSRSDEQRELLAKYAKMKHSHMNFVKESEANRLKDSVLSVINEEMDEIMLTDGSRKIVGNIDMNQNILKNLSQPVDDGDSVSKIYLENSLGDCLKLDGKQRYDVGGNQLTGINSNPISSLDAINKQYFDTNAVTTDSLNKTLDDFATKKYVDDEIQKQDQGDKSKNVNVDLSNYYEKEDVDTYIKDLKSQHKLDVSSLNTKINSLENKIQSLKTNDHYVQHCTHNNEDEIEFASVPAALTKFYAISNDKRTLTIKEKGIWQVTLIDQIKESGGLKNVEMIVTNQNLERDDNKYYQTVKKSSKWSTFYFSRILDLKANATIKIRFSGKSDSGFDGLKYSKIITMRYL